MRQATMDAWRRGSLWATLVTWPVLIYLVWFVAPDWSGLADVSAPLTRKVLFFHPASAWAAFAAYFVVFALSIAVLNERDAKYDAPARAAAEVGFWSNTVALATGTLWGIQEWSDSGNASLATVYSEPKVLVVVVLWFTFAAYLLLRRLVDGEERRARLCAAFGVLGFLGVPLSFATSRLLSTSLHPDIAGPGANPDAAVGPTVGYVLAFSAVAFLALFIHLWLARLRLARLADRIESLETA
ncbi:MAG TPA: cytochrome c biogenesis protein CcsA [Candidatus Thermoplasmatota archaeon]|nr:cytochrome c biogenesis protein CcsA [Candidatus Thermoplasmatota archaeon]